MTKNGERDIGANVLETTVLIQLGTVIAAGGAAWGAAKQALNGTRERVKRIDDQLIHHIKDDDALQRELLQRTSSVEAKVDILIDRLD